MLRAAEILEGKILIVDDQAANVLLLAKMLSGAGYVSVTCTAHPDEVCGLHLQNHYDLILLDLQMPVMSGFQVMDELRKIEPDGYLPVLVITAQPGHKLRALEAGAKDFITKPFDRSEVLLRVRNMLEVRLLNLELRNYSELLEQRVLARTADLQENYLETVLALIRAAEHKDEDTGLHVRRIGHYSRELADVLGLDAECRDQIFCASPMHDVGKIGIPDHILQKPGALTLEDWSIMKTHTLMGAKILGAGKSPYLRMGAEIALHHHERWDGGGYPHGIGGEAIPLVARIVNISDIYDALRSKRPYKSALDHLAAVEIITHGDARTEPTHFDPAVLAAFCQHHERFRDIYETFRI